jgi:hypothetical protein
MGIATEEEAKEAACQFAVGNDDMIPKDIRVVYGEVYKNEVVECNLTII